MKFANFTLIAIIFSGLSQLGFVFELALKIGEIPEAADSTTIYDWRNR